MNPMNPMNPDPMDPMNPNPMNPAVPEMPLPGRRPVCGFRDVASDDWCASAVEFVRGRRLMNGTSASAFSPRGTMTRGMVVTVLYRLAGSPASDGKSFYDVKNGSYCADASRWAAANGVVNGHRDGSFRPNEPVTREQLAAFLHRYAKLTERSGSSVSLKGFPDGFVVSGYARDALSWAVGSGLLNGTMDGRLDPRGLASRAQVAAILMRFCNTFGA